MDTVSGGLSKKVALEFGMNHVTVSMSANNISPDSTGFVHFATRSHCVVLCFVYVSTFLVQIEFCFISGINTFNFKKGSYVLPLGLEDSACSQQKKKLPGLQPSRHICCFRSPILSIPLQPPETAGRERPICF